MRFCDFLFCKSFETEKSFIENFCSSPKTSLIQTIYITGSVATGKSTLLGTILTELKASNPNLRIESFDLINVVGHFLLCLDNNTLDKFVHRYLRHDIVLIDNLEFIDYRPASSTMVDLLLSTLQLANKKIVLTSMTKNVFNACPAILNSNKFILDLNKNKLDQKRFIKIKSAEFGLHETNVQCDSNDPRELEGVIKTKKFSAELYGD